MRATWIRMTFSDVTFNYSNLNIVEIEESNFTNVIIDKSNLNKIYLNTSSKTEIIIQNSFTLYMSCDDCSNISFSNNASVAVMRNPHSLPVKQKLPFDQ